MPISFRIFQFIVIHTVKGFGIVNKAEIYVNRDWAAGTVHRLRPRGATPLLRSEAAAERTPLLRGGGQEELPHVQGQGQRLRVPGCDSEGTAERNYPTSEVRGSGREELSHVRGRVAAERSYPMFKVKVAAESARL